MQITAWKEKQYEPVVKQILAKKKQEYKGILQKTLGLGFSFCLGFSFRLYFAHSDNESD